MIRLDKVKATAHLASIEYDGELENGMVVALGDLLPDGEGYQAKMVEDAATDRVVIHASVPIDYAEPNFEDEFVLLAGKKGRGYIPETGDIVTITDDLFDGAVSVGDTVAPVAGSLKLKTAVEPVTAKVKAVVIAKEYLGAHPATVIEIL